MHLASSTDLTRRLRTPRAAPVVSFELFPPRTARGRARLHESLGHLLGAEPDLLSVTYGAAGSDRERSAVVLAEVRERAPVPVVAHLTCAGTTRVAMRDVLGRLLDLGVRHVLALRGDTRAGGGPDELPRASDLVALVREVEQERFGRRVLTVAVAATPSGVGGARLRGDLAALRAKEEAGADLALTQVFFDPAHYLRYVDGAREAGIGLPVVPGAVPLDDPDRLRRLQEVSGVVVPASWLARLDAATTPDRPAVGADLAGELYRPLLDAGAPGLHVYTFNRYRPALDLLEAVGLRTRG